MFEGVAHYNPLAMTLSAGMRLGPYEIVAPIGAGGMGEVYRARDTRLDRTVAIKVLPANFSSDAVARERFDREARSIAALNHPHICTLYDVRHEAASGADSPIDFLVMEYLEGETLAARLARGPLPVNLVFRHAIEIAEALDKAHRHGIVHRDLKPGNVMLTKAGAKLLDFGLAKAGATGAPGATGATGATGAVTLEPLTGAGMIIGTVQYMAPEQVEGRATDARTDIFAFGALVHEMATGRKVFEGRSQASIIAAILDAQPPAISTLQPVLPGALDHIVRRCLAKDPDERWQSANDLASELRWIAGSEGGAAQTSGITAAAPSRRHVSPLSCCVRDQPPPRPPSFVRFCRCRPAPNSRKSMPAPPSAFPPMAGSSSSAPSAMVCSVSSCGRRISSTRRPSKARKEPLVHSSLPTASGWGFLPMGAC